MVFLLFTVVYEVRFVVHDMFTGLSTVELLRRDLKMVASAKWSVAMSSIPVHINVSAQKTSAMVFYREKFQCI